MKKLLIGCSAIALLMPMLGCGGGGGASSPAPQSPAVNVTGTWRGTVISSVTGSNTATLVLNQTAAAVSGNYSTNGGQLGNVTGTVSGSTLAFTITPTQAGCTGSLSGTGTVAGTTTMSFSYSGTTSCGGAESGTGSLTKQ